MFWKGKSVGTESGFVVAWEWVWELIAVENEESGMMEIL